MFKHIKACEDNRDTGRDTWKLGIVRTPIPMWTGDDHTHRLARCEVNRESVWRWAGKAGNEDWAWAGADADSEFKAMPSTA